MKASIGSIVFLASILISILLMAGLTSAAVNETELDDLTYAISTGNLTNVQGFLNAGNDAKEKAERVNMKIDANQTVLTNAVLRRETNIVKYLLDNGANASMPNIFGETPLGLALTYHYDDVAMALIPKINNAELSSPHRQYGNLTPLIFATYSALSPSVVGQLITDGSIGSTLGPSNYTVFMTALVAKFEEKTTEDPAGASDSMLKMILSDSKSKSILNSKEASGMTALAFAASLGRDQAVKILLEAGADANIKDPVGWNALMTSLDANCTRCAGLLLDSGKIDLNSRDNNNSTALIKATKKNYPEIVQKILDKGNVDVNARNIYDRSALDIALTKGFTDIAELLKKKGATPAPPEVTASPNKAESNKTLADITNSSRIGNATEAPTVKLAM